MGRYDTQVLVGIVVVTLLAIAIDLSGIAPYTLNLFGHQIVVQQGVDLQGGARILLQAEPEKGQAVTDNTMSAATQIIQNRVSGGFGVSEPIVQAVSSGNQHYISVELPGLRSSLSSVEQSLQKTGQLTFVALNATYLPPGASTKGYQVIARGTDVNADDVAVGTDQFGAPAVNVTVTGAAADAIQTYSGQHIGGYMGIAIDNKIYESPQIQAQLTGNFQITKVGSVADANALAATLKYGALPVPLKIQSIQSVSATLGPSNIRASLLAGAAGLLIVMLFMAIYYRLPGLLADLALIVYALVVFSTFKLFNGYTLTLAGIAGFILSIGMAVDANILIFERTKEELRSGRSLMSAVDNGFRRAWPSIRDSNASTMITCLILWYFGSKFATSTIVGFATTLFIGVALSMVTAILVSRTFLRLALRAGASRHRTLFGTDIHVPEVQGT